MAARQKNEILLDAWVRCCSIPLEPSKIHTRALTPVDQSQSSATSTLPAPLPVIPSPLEFWTKKENFPHKVATVLSLSQSASGFNPVDPKTTPEQFVSYAGSLQKFPGAILHTYDGQTSTYDSTDIKLSISNIVNLFVGLETGQLKQITDSIQKMADNVFSQSTAEDFLVKFTQQVLDNSATYPYTYVYVYYTSFKASKKTTSSGGKTNTSASQSLTIQRLIFQFNDSFLISYASQLNQLTASSLQAWIDQNSTTKGDKKVSERACFTGDNVPVRQLPKLEPIELEF